MKYLIKFSYDGSVFKGYQRQKGLKTVQGVLEDNLTLLNNGKSTFITSSGRTDALVHARCQVAHFTLDKGINVNNIKRFLNKKLNGEIYIKDVSEVPLSFHARYDVLCKEYRYFINTLEYDVFKRLYEYQYCKPLDINKMKEASLYFLGCHNFKSLCNNSKERVNFDRCINSISIENNNGIIQISVIGNGFLKQMVRNIVGILIKAGEGMIKPSKVKEILDSMDRCYNIKSAPACGLYLWDVRYK